MKPPLNGVVCTGFDSPWVCNCDCPWSNHQQRFEEIEASSFDPRLITPSGEICVPIEMTGEDLGMEVLDAGIKRGAISRSGECVSNGDYKGESIESSNVGTTDQVSDKMHHKENSAQSDNLSIHDDSTERRKMRENKLKRLNMNIRRRMEGDIG